jgi:hypothetical protein
LLARSWTVSRNNRGNRQGAAPLGNWLPTLIAEEGPALQLRRYQQQRKTSPNSCRVSSACWSGCTWPARCLEVPEVDHLYGELNKLTDLAHQTIG